MTEHEYNRTEKRRTEGTAGRRYQQGGRDRRQWDQQGGQTGQRFGQQTGGETGQQTGGQRGPQSSYGTGGQMSHGTSSQMGQQSGGQRTGGQQTGGRPDSQMGGGRTGGQTSRGTGQMGRGTSQMGRGASSQMGQGTSSQTSQGTSSQTWRETGQMGGRTTQQDQGLISPVTVRDVAATEVVTVQPDAPLTEAVQRMRRENVGSVVVTEGSRPVGIVTDRKVALALEETQDVSQLRVTDLMSENLITVPEGTNVFDLVRRLSDKGVRRVPVVGDGGDLKGIVSLDDVVVLLAEEFYNVSQIIRKQSPRF